MRETDILKVIQQITGAAKLEDAPLALAADIVRRLLPRVPIQPQPLPVPVEVPMRPENGLKPDAACV